MRIFLRIKQRLLLLDGTCEDDSQAGIIQRPRISSFIFRFLHCLGKQFVNILRDEFQMALALTGRPNIRSIDRSILWT